MNATPPIIIINNYNNKKMCYRQRSPPYPKHNPTQPLTTSTLPSPKLFQTPTHTSNEQFWVSFPGMTATFFKSGAYGLELSRGKEGEKLYLTQPL